MLDRACLLRMFLLQPSRETNNALIYCLACAAARCNVDILLPYAASNHTHIVLFDRDGRISEFMEYFHKLFARCQNARLGRWEPLWAAEEPCLVRLLDRQTVINKLVYAASNPVKDGLVEKAHHWPGVNGYVNFVNRRPLRARRPLHFFSRDGVMPAEITLQLVVPPELGDPDQVIAEVRAGVHAIEEEQRKHRARTGKRVVGVKRICAQSWRSTPTSEAPRRNLRPRFAGTTPNRVAALYAFKEFLLEYTDARGQLLAGHLPVFPPGTYWLARFASVVVRQLAGPLPAL